MSKNIKFKYRLGFVATPMALFGTALMIAFWKMPSSLPLYIEYPIGAIAALTLTYFVADALYDFLWHAYPFMREEETGVYDDSEPHKMD